MKNGMHILYCLILLTTGTLSYGQANKFDIGAEAGPSFVLLQGNLILKEYNKAKMGFCAGLSFQYNLRKIISIRTGLSYERKGTTMEFPIDPTADPLTIFTLERNLDYLTIPLHVRASLGKKAQFFIHAGGFFGYLMKAGYIAKLDNVYDSSGDNTGYYQPFDAGLSTGLGCALPVSKKLWLSLELRNNLGLYNISADTYFTDGIITTNSTSLLLGFAYRLGQRTAGS